MPDSSATRLHHVALGSADVEHLAAFYREVFGLRELARHSHPSGALRSIWLDLVGAILMIEHTAEPPRPVLQLAQGPFLLALRVTPAERTRLEHVLAARGLPIESRSPYSSYARDPDGNRIAISHYPDPPEPSSSTG